MARFLKTRGRHSPWPEPPARVSQARDGPGQKRKFRRLCIASALLSFFSFASFLSFFPFSSNTTTTTTSPPNLSSSASAAISQHPSLLAPIFDALLFYATSSSTLGHMTDPDLRAAAAVLRRRAPCNLLVFGLGHESPSGSPSTTMVTLSSSTIATSVLPNSRTSTLASRASRSTPPPSPPASPTSTPFSPPSAQRRRAPVGTIAQFRTSYSPIAPSRSPTSPTTSTASPGTSSSSTSTQAVPGRPHDGPCRA